MRALIVGLVVAGALVACSNSTEVRDGAKLALDQHQSEWEQRTFGSYQYNLDLQDGSFAKKVHIAVNGTAVVSVVDTAGRNVTGAYQYPTIDDLFATAQADFGQANTTLQVEFDQQYGYPTTLIVTTSTGDAVYSAHASNLAPGP